MKCLTRDQSPRYTHIVYAVHLKKKKNQPKKWAENLNRHSPKIYRWP